MQKIALSLPLATLLTLAATCPLNAEASLVGPAAPSVLPRTPPAEPMKPALVDAAARWEQVAGCARDIAAGGNGVVYVTGCDVAPNSRGASAIFRWSGAAFLPLSVPGLGSALATLGGNSYAIGGDAMLYSSINDGEWRKRGTPDNQPITDIGAGRAGIWIITSQPNSEGGNAISRSERCPSAALTGGNDYCGWRAVEGSAVRISVGAGAWVVNAQGNILEWRDGSSQWVQRPGCFTDVAANGETVYAVSCRRGQGDGNAIYRWNNAGSWVDVAGNAWAITDSGSIWRRTDNLVPADLD